MRPRVHRAGVRFGLRRAAQLVAVALVVGATTLTGDAPSGAAPSEMPDDLWITNGRVAAVRQVGDFIYLGGSFTQVGPATGHGVVVDPDSGAITDVSPHVDGVVFAAAPDGNGGWYLGGQFSAVNGVGRSNAAHVLADGSVSSWNPFTDGMVRAITVTPTSIILGGDFTQVRTVPRSRLAAVRPDSGGVLDGWNPAPDARVHALAVTTDARRVIVGGEFTTVGGLPRGRLAAVDVATGQVDPVFVVSADGVVRTVDVSPDGGRVYLGGDFTIIGLVPRQRIAAVDASTGGIDLGFMASADRDVRTLRVHPDGTRVYVGGAFTKLGNVPRNHLGAVDSTGKVLPWAPFATGAIETIALSPTGDDAIVGGFFSSLDKTPAMFAGRVSLVDGRPLATFDVRADGVVRTAVWQEEAAFLGGGFGSIGSIRQPFLARLHAATGELDTAWRPVLDEVVTTMDDAVDGSALYVAGRFTTVDGQPRGRGAAFDPVAGTLRQWDPRADQQVNVVRAAGGEVFVGGRFGTLDGNTLHRFIARTDATTGSADPLWQPLPNGAVHAIVTDTATDQVYIGGSFSFVGLNPRKNIAALSRSGVPTSFNPGAPAIVHSLDLSDDSQLLFAGIGGGNNEGGNAVAAYWTAGAGSVRWKHQGNGDVQVVRAGADATVYVGGHFKYMRSPVDVRRGLAVFDAPTGALKPFAPTLFWSDLGVWDIDETDAGLLVGGDQQRIGTLALRGIARFPH